MTAGKRKKRSGPGVAYLVGAGPGDPGLITVRGRELLLTADAIVYDALANPELLKLERPAGEKTPELHDVGKRGGGARENAGEVSARQESINELLVQLVREGKKVVRLKGGDPFVFGRGGEEAQALAEAGLAFEVVPGVTAGIAGPAYAGIPVTHRGLSTSVTLVTGHEDPMKGAPQVDFEALARSGGTIVLYMGVKKLPDVVTALVKGGMPAEIPAAVIQWGTKSEQRTVVATLETIVEQAASHGISAPAITVIGWTVVLRDEISWFDRKPLFGRRVVVTRPEDSRGGSRLASRLRNEGAEVLEVSATRLVAVDPSELRKKLAQLNSYQWVMFTSANAVEFFWLVLRAADQDSRALRAVKIGAVGPATAAALEERGIVADVVAKRFAAEGLLEVLTESEMRGSAVLYPCAEGARAVLQSGLEEMGAIVDRVNIYRSEANRDTAGLLRDTLSNAEKNLIVVFASASAVKAFVNAAGSESASGVSAVSIGPITSQALRDAGIEVAVEADEASIDGLVGAILRTFGESDD